MKSLTLIIIPLLLTACASGYDLNSNYARCMGYGNSVNDFTSVMSDYDRFRYQSQNGMSMNNPSRIMQADCHRMDSP